MSIQIESRFCVTRPAPVKMSNDPAPHYPLHDSVKDRLHQQYVEFYNTYLINAQQSHKLPISVSRKNSVVFGGSALLPVGLTTDRSVQRRQTPGPSVPVRCFIPSGQPPALGWPVMLYIHGGGWVLGNIDSENHICTNLCVRSNCVVITPEYRYVGNGVDALIVETDIVARLAPEHPFPAPLHDCWETLLWIAGAGARDLNLNTAKIAVGGCSAGANLAAAIVNQSLTLQPQVGIVSQLLLVPVLDNTALPSNNATWKQNEFTAALPAAKMLWYRQHYLPDAIDRARPEASPIFFLSQETASPSSSSELSSEQETTISNRLLSELPPTIIIVGGVDILRYEGEEYGRLLRENGVRTSVHVMEGMPHPFAALDNVLDDGKKAISLLCDELNRAFRIA